MCKRDSLITFLYLSLSLCSDGQNNGTTNDDDNHTLTRLTFHKGQFWIAQHPHLIPPTHTQCEMDKGKPRDNLLFAIPSEQSLVAMAHSMFVWSSHSGSVAETLDRVRKH